MTRKKKWIGCAVSLFEATSCIGWPQQHSLKEKTCPKQTITNGNEEKKKATKRVCAHRLSIWVLHESCVIRKKAICFNISSPAIRVSQHHSLALIQHSRFTSAIYSSAFHWFVNVFTFASLSLLRCLFSFFNCLVSATTLSFANNITSTKVKNTCNAIR